MPTGLQTFASPGDATPEINAWFIRTHPRFEEFLKWRLAEISDPDVADACEFGEDAGELAEDVDMWMKWVETKAPELLNLNGVLAAPAAMPASETPTNSVPKTSIPAAESAEDMILEEKATKRRRTLQTRLTPETTTTTASSSNAVTIAAGGSAAAAVAVAVAAPDASVHALSRQASTSTLAAEAESGGEEAAQVLLAAAAAQLALSSLPPVPPADLRKFVLPVGWVPHKVVPPVITTLEEVMSYTA
jgi:hypothetical protein